MAPPRTRRRKTAARRDSSSERDEPVPVSQDAIVDAHVRQAVKSATSFTARYVADVVSTSIQLLRRPLSVLLFVYLLFLIVGRLSHTIRAAFAPLCVIPGISSTTMCLGPPHPGSAHGPPRWADYPALVEVQSKTFEQLLDDTAGGNGLALDIKKAEMATTDLATVIRVSDLTSKDLIADTLAEFVEDAKRTGAGLQKLSSKIGGAVDRVMAVNDYALNTIGAASHSPSIMRSLWPFPSSPSSVQTVTETFSHAMDILSGSMHRLILEAEVSLSNLEKLEERLSTLHELVSREDSTLSRAQSELLAELWTKLGGNRRKVRGHDQNLFLLRNLGSYRKQALVHVVSALQTLRAMSEDMEDLRERVAAPELVGSRIPVEVHMKSIKSGLERLKEGRIRAREREEEAVRRVLAIADD
ncbi:hypothetical protein PLICRDRAFT_57020 [Plicaturopsis crispa FD-325 SS-3]|uniref:Uncharacterized protein n=1 Tax=Plicaturopsis crispa FD-325 SS-3 TaxID=944288 RepID=A0A0C9SRW7_PLICR|nr:hypothetical protein PLICRDRAFT_57020 [Plicaturopsis crispa FD-325 SS-3]